MKKRLLSVAFLMGAWGAYSQVGIGTTAPNKSSQLEIVAKDRGVLIPQVPLKSTTDKTTITHNNVTSLLVWNTNTVADITPGYYYWFEDKWMRIVDTDTFASLDSNTKNTSLTVQGDQLVLTDSDGGTVSIPLSAVNIPTTLVKNPDGTYTYTNEEGATVTIDATDNVIHNIENILGDTNVLNELITVLGDTYVGGNVYFDGDQFTYVTQDGETKVINFNDIVKANETVTTIVDNVDGTYTYTNEAGDTAIIDVPSSFVQNLETIINKGPVTVNGDTFNTVEEYLTHIANASITIGGSDFVEVTGTGTTADPYKVEIKEGANDSMLVTNAAGELEWATIESIVQANETVTTLVAGADGKYTYTSEDNTVTVIDIPASVVENFETIVNEGPVTINGDTFNTIEEYIEHIANTSVKLGGSAFVEVSGTGTATDPYKVSIIEGTKNSMLITNAAGDLEWTTIESIVQANETVTTLVAGADGKYTYTSEDNTVTVIDIPASVVENFETIVNDGPVTVNGDTFNTIEDYITHIANNVSNIEGSDFITVTGDGTVANPYKVEIKEGAKNSMLITNAAGELEWAIIESIVKDNETVTRIEELDGVYTYYNEENTPFVIDIPASVVENFENIYNQIVNEEIEVNGDTYNTFEEYLTQIINNNTNFEDNDFITVTGDGTAANPYEITIKEGDDNSMLITNAAGELEWATIESIVKDNETVTRIEELDGVYTYYNEENTPFVIDIPASVVENFENIYNQIVNEEIEVNGDTYNTFEEYLTQIINNNTNFEDNDFITVTGDGTAANPYEIAIKEGDDNSMLITNAAGELEWATIESIVKDNETVTRIEELDGVYTYYNEENTPFVIDIPASVVENFENIYNQIVNEEIEVNGETYNTFEEYLTTIVNNNTNFEDNDFITVTGDGSTDNPYEITIKEGDENSMLITNAAGELEWATIESIVQANETETILRANTDGTYTYFNEKAIDADGNVIEANGVIINIPASVVENFENIYNQIVNEEIEVNGETYNTFEEYLTTIVNNNTNFEDNDFITVTGDGSTDNPYEITIKEGDENSMLITNEEGDLEWATIEDIVNNNITKGSLTVTGGIELTSGDGVDALLVSTQIGIADGGIITDKLADGAVTPGKIDGGNLGDILVTTDDGRKVEWMSKEDATTNELKLDGSKLTSTVNGVASEVTLTDTNITSDKGITGVGITVDGGTGATLKEVTLTLTPGNADQVMITKNGVATWVDQSEIVPETTNKLESSVNTLTSTVNGEEATADIISSVANSLNDDNELVTTVNGVSGNGLDLTPAIQANQKTVTVVDGTNTTVNETVTGNNTEYKVNVSDEAINEAITLAGDVTGKVGETNLAAIQGTPVIADGTKTAGQALVFDGTNWVPGKPLVDVTDLLNAKNLTAADADEATIEVVTGGEKAVLVETSLRVKEESITTGHIQDGTIKPEDIANAGSNQVLVTGADNKPVWKDQNKVAPQFFYMPAVIFDTSATGTATRDLYQEYVNQFTGGAVGTGNAPYDISHGPAGTTPIQYAGGIVGSTGAPADIAVLGKGDLYYYVTYYDEAVFENLSIDAEGNLTYTVKAGATPSSYMNIVFVIK